MGLDSVTTTKNIQLTCIAFTMAKQTVRTLLALSLSGFALLVESSICFGPGLNQQGNWCGAGDGDSRCPWYQNLLPHVPLTEDRCPVSTLYERPGEACSGDSDCCWGSYCCFSICEGIAKCYNPYHAEFTDTNNIKPCNGTIKTPCPPPVPESTATTSTTTTTAEPPTNPPPTSTTTTTTTTPDPECEYGCPAPVGDSQLPTYVFELGR